MEAIGDMQLRHEKEEWLFKYTPIPNASMYWPNGMNLEDIKDAPRCGFDGSRCVKEQVISKLLRIHKGKNYYRKDPRYITFYISESKTLIFSQIY